MGVLYGLLTVLGFWLQLSLEWLHVHIRYR